MRISTSSYMLELKEVFTISRGAKKDVEILRLELSDGEYQGVSESVPYPRYGDSCGVARSQLEEIRPHIEKGVTQAEALSLLKPGAARNALDNAWLELTAQCEQKTLSELLGLQEPAPVKSALTVSMDRVEKMYDQAKSLARKSSILKVKLGQSPTMDGPRIMAVRKAAPSVELWVDANEGWSTKDYLEMLPSLKEAGVTLIEQPLAVSADGELVKLPRPIPVCADESAHTRKDLPRLMGKYDAVNVKLDKAGGLSEGLAMIKQARSYNLLIMLGCMVGSSLSIAPSWLLAHLADFVDLDGFVSANEKNPRFSFVDGEIRQVLY